jgi:hypothetical protein
MAQLLLDEFAVRYGASMLLAAMACAGCQSSPARQSARALDAAASSAASVAFAERRYHAGDVPRAFVRDAIASAAREVRQVRLKPDTTIATTTISTLDGLASMLDDAQRTGTWPDEGALVSAADRLREAARRVRQAAR